MRVIIVGAGIGGTSAFRALKRLGMSPKVYERAQEILPMGAGITLAPNGLHILKQLGLFESISSIGVSERVVTGYDSTGAKIGGTDFSTVESKFGYPLLGMSRHALQMELLKDLQPGSDVIYGKAVKNIEQAGGRIAVEFDDGSVEEADVVVGADGARSAVSTHVTGSSGSELLRPTGFVCTYGITPPGSHPEADAGNVSWMYPAEGNTERSWGTWCVPGGYFWFTVHRHGALPHEAGTSPQAGVQSWGANVDHLSAIKAAFSGLYHPSSGGFDRVLASTERSAMFGLADKGGSSHPFAKGSVALLGDAARTVTPWGGQGANMAIEDAAELANALAPLIKRGGAVAATGGRGAEVASALRAYESARTRRSALVTAFSRQTGALQMLPGYTGRLARKAALSMPGWATMASIGWLYGHRIELV